MLSEAQKELVTLKVNAETDLPLLSESTEERVIEKILDVVNDKLEPSLRAMCPEPYVDCLKIALAEGVPVTEKRAAISEILNPVLAQPLAVNMAGMVDVALVPEHLEERVMSVVCRKIIDEFVEWTVGEIDERLSERLQQSRSLGGDDES